MLDMNAFPKKIYIYAVSNIFQMRVLLSGLPWVRERKALKLMVPGAAQSYLEMSPLTEGRWRSGSFLLPTWLPVGDRTPLIPLCQKKLLVTSGRVSQLSAAVVPTYNRIWKKQCYFQPPDMQHTNGNYECAACVTSATGSLPVVMLVWWSSAL